MTDGDALYRAILDDPDDDAPRLVWADWLEEHGDPDRAEFIRLQCEWTHLVPGHPRYAGLMAAWQAPEGRHRDRWTAGLGEFARFCGFWRGLPDWFEVDTGNAVERLESIRRHVPAQCVGLHLSGFREALRHWPGLETIRYLAVWEDSPDPYYPHSSLRGWVWLIQSPRLRRLRGFRASINPMSAGVIPAIAGTDWPHLWDLTFHVRGVGSNAPPAAWAALCDADWFPGLRSLKLYGCRLGEDLVAHLLTSGGPLALEHLELGANGLSDGFVRRLARSPKLPALRLISLGKRPPVAGPSAAPDLTAIDPSE
jgi:uncharacterized protein (TIGR02996 family)